MEVWIMSYSSFFQVASPIMFHIYVMEKRVIASELRHETLCFLWKYKFFLENMPVFALSSACNTTRMDSFQDLMPQMNDFFGG